MRELVDYGLSYLDAHGVPTVVNRAGVSEAEQLRQYRLFKAGKGPPAHQPRHSAHVIRNGVAWAIDVTHASGSAHPHQVYVRLVLKKLGLVQPYPHEPWHFEVPDWQRYA